MSIKTVESFNKGLKTLGASKSKLDVVCQQLADFAINQSISHRNADCGIRLVKQMRDGKYGNVQAMVKYLCTYGWFDVNQKTQTMVFLEQEHKELMPENEKAIWLNNAKVEHITAPCDDAFIVEQMQKLVKRAKAWAKKHPDQAVSDTTLNKMLDILPKPAIVETLTA